MTRQALWDLQRLAWVSVGGRRSGNMVWRLARRFGVRPTVLPGQATEGLTIWLALPSVRIP